LIRRLSGRRETPERHPSRRPPTDDIEAPPLLATRTIKPPAAAETRPGTAVARDLMEISEEDLDLFPSLRQAPEEVVAGGAPDEISPAPRDGASTQPLEPEELLAAASLAMQNAEMRDDIADAMLGFCAPLFRRRMMLVVRRDSIIGWRGEGVGIDRGRVRAVSIPADEPSVFSGLLQGVEFWLGPLPSMPHNADIAAALGRPRPRDCYILPVRLKDKVVCFLYGDNLEDGVGGLPIAELKRLGSKASLAFQVYLMKGKIRTL
jgi:hypothetical protein